MHDNKSLKIILVSLSISVLSIFVVYYFLYQDIKLKNEHTSAISQELSLETNKQSYLNLTKRIIQNINPDLALVDNSIISKDGDVKFIDSLEATAQENGLTITIDSLVFEDSLSVPSSEITTLKIQAKTKGGWIGTYKFLGQLESLPIKVKVDKFEFTNTSVDINSDTNKVSTPNDVWQSTFEIHVLKYK